MGCKTQIQCQMSENDYLLLLVLDQILPQNSNRNHFLKVEEADFVEANSAVVDSAVENSVEVNSAVENSAGANFAEAKYVEANSVVVNSVEANSAQVNSVEAYFAEVNSNSVGAD